jgi:hypothetical protein
MNRSTKKKSSSSSRAKKKPRRRPTASKRRRRAARKNPSLVVFGANPRGARVFGTSVEAIYYRHAEDGQRYVHDFERKDIRMYGLNDGSVLIKGPRGVRIWEHFE